MEVENGVHVILKHAACLTWSRVVSTCLSRARQRSIAVQEDHSQECTVRVDYMSEVGSFHVIKKAVGTECMHLCVLFIHLSLLLAKRDISVYHLLAIPTCTH